MHARIQEVLPEGDFDNGFLFFFFDDEGREETNATINGPSSDHQRNAI